MAGSEISSYGSSPEFSDESLIRKIHRLKELSEGCENDALKEELSEILQSVTQIVGRGLEPGDDEEARDNLKRLELAVDTVNLAWWSMDVPTGNVLFHKRKAEMLGYNPADFTHYTHFTQILHPDDYEKSMQAMRDHIYNNAPTYECLYRIRKSDGSYTWFSDAGAIVKRTEDGKPLKIVGFVIDVSKLKQAELEIVRKNEELTKTNAEKDKFFSIIAHDLRNPLWALMQYSEFLIEDSENMSADERDQMLKSLSESASNAHKLLENLLEWSRMQRGYTTFEPAALNIHDSVAEAIKILRDSAALKNIRINFYIDSDQEVYADKNMIQLVIRNLVSNAIKFTPAGGTVEISVSVPHNGFVLLSVKDTGIGIPPAMLKNLFSLTSDAKRPGTGGEKSTGLGLILCKEYVEKNGGTISVESEEGKGSVFSFTVPVSPTASE